MKAKIWMSEQFPIKLPEILPALEVLAVQVHVDTSMLAKVIVVVKLCGFNCRTSMLRNCKGF